MKSSNFLCLLLALLLTVPTAIFAQETAAPVSPHASPEARALLQLLYNLSGKYTLTGQHNFPAARDRNSRFAAGYTGKTPVIWSTDFGFAREGDKDSYKKRGDMVEEAIRQNNNGTIIALCWHAVPPTASEPVTFQPIPGSSPDRLASVQGRLTDQQFADVLTPGTALHKQWVAQVDTIAFYLKKLQKAHVPVLWRPYHEMNGNWFWWGNCTGKYSTAALYRQVFERLVNYHHLDNLVWVWSVDRPTKPGMEFANFYPGDKYLDVLALDVYGSDFKQEYYDGLISLSKGKPVTLGEVGTPPAPSVLDKQPKWSYWIVWAGMVRNAPKKQYEALSDDPRILGLDDPAFINALNPFRMRIGLPLLPLKKSADFSGEWVLNEDKSILGNSGTGNLASRLTVDENENKLEIQRSYVEEWREDRVTEEKMTLNGEESKSEFMNFPEVSTASQPGDTLLIKRKVTFNIGGHVSEVSSFETWTLQVRGKELAITTLPPFSQPGGKTITLIYDKQ